MHIPTSSVGFSSSTNLAGGSGRPFCKRTPPWEFQFQGRLFSLKSEKARETNAAGMMHVGESRKKKNEVGTGTAGMTDGP